MGTMLGLSFLVLSAAVLSASGDIQKKPGDGVALQCLVPSNIAVMAWRHQSVGDVIVLRNNHSYESNQHPSFRGRVNYTFIDGNFAVNLKNVTVNDSGTYECVIGLKNGALVSISNISLTVTDSGPKAGHTEEGGNLHRGSGLMGLMAVPVLGLIVFLVYKRLMKKNPEQPAADEKPHVSPEPVEVQCQSV